VQLAREHRFKYRYTVAAAVAAAAELMRKFKAAPSLPSEGRAFHSD
jgi:hypothetical protein